MKVLPSNFPFEEIKQGVRFPHIFILEPTMYEGYTGFGPNKTMRFKEEKLDAAIHRANVFMACGLHCGIMVDGKVVFHTNKEDAEYLAFLEESADG